MTSEGDWREILIMKVTIFICVLSFHEAWSNLRRLNVFVHKIAGLTFGLGFFGKDQNMYSPSWPRTQDSQPLLLGGFLN